MFLNSGKSLKLCRNLGYKCDTWFHANTTKRNPGIAHYVENHEAKLIYVQDDVSVSIKINYLQSVLDSMETDGIWPLCLLSGGSSVDSSNCLAVVTLYNAMDKSLSWVCLELDNKENKKFEVEFTINGEWEDNPAIKWKVEPVPVLNLKTTSISDYALLRIPGESLFEKYTDPEDNRSLMINVKRYVVNTGRRTVNAEQNCYKRRSGLTKILGTIVPRCYDIKEPESFTKEQLWDSLRKSSEKLIAYCNRVGAAVYPMVEAHSKKFMEN